MKSTLLSRKYIAGPSSCKVIELHKINGRIFHIEGDVHNCVQYWRIAIFSPTTYAWNPLFAMDDIPGLKSIDYHHCSIEDKTYGWLPNDVFIDNIKILIEYAEKFVYVLE